MTGRAKVILLHKSKGNRKEYKKYIEISLFSFLEKVYARILISLMDEIIATKL